MEETRPMTLSSAAAAPAAQMPATTIVAPVVLPNPKPALVPAPATASDKK